MLHLEGSQHHRILHLEGPLFVVYQVRVSLVEMVHNIWLWWILLRDNGMVLSGIQMLKLLNVSNLLLSREILHFCPSNMVALFAIFSHQGGSICHLPFAKSHSRITSLCILLYTNEWICFMIENVSL